MFRKLLFKLLKLAVVASMDDSSVTVTSGGKPVFEGRATNIYISRDSMRGNKGRIEISFNEMTEHLGAEA